MKMPVSINVYYDRQMIDHINMGEANQAVRLEITKPEALVQLRITQPGREAHTEDAQGNRTFGPCPGVGSVSFPAYLFLQAPLKQAQKLWITLFDFVEDDEYDGDLSENDDERPRILLQFKLTNDPPAVKKPEPVPAKQLVKTTKTSYSTAGVRETTTTTTHQFHSNSQKHSYVSNSSQRESKEARDLRAKEAKKVSHSRVEQEVD